jgi:L-fuculose-phosphate aldolase
MKRPDGTRSTIHPSDLLTRAMERIYSYRMTTTSGGNLSILDEAGSVWITPARIDKGGLRREDIVEIRPDGEIVGRHKPSSEFPFHRGIYKARPDIRAIIHAHPVALVAFSICGKTPDTRLFPKAYSICGEVGFAPYALPGSEELGASIAAEFAKGFSCVMLENHGVVVGGANFEEAFRRFETLEFAAKTIVKASNLGNVRYVGEAALEAEKKLGEPLESFQPGSAGARERELRRELADFVRRGYRQRLLISTEGSFSARVSEKSFVITPRGCDRAELTPEELVLVDQGRAEAGKRVSFAARLHRAIYTRHPGVQAIVNATPVNATAYAVVGEHLDTRTIPESYVFLRAVEKLPLSILSEDPAKVAARLSPNFPVYLIENDGAMVLGTSLLDAFDRLEVLESTSEALINSRPLGPVRVMGDDVIRELETAFHLPPR